MQVLTYNANSFPVSHCPNPASTVKSGITKHSTCPAQVKPTTVETSTPPTENFIPTSTPILTSSQTTVLAAVTSVKTTVTSSAVQNTVLPSTSLTPTTGKRLFELQISLEPACMMKHGNHESR